MKKLCARQDLTITNQLSWFWQPVRDCIVLWCFLEGILTPRGIRPPLLINIRWSWRIVFTFLLHQQWQFTFNNTLLRQCIYRDQNWRQSSFTNENIDIHSLLPDKEPSTPWGNEEKTIVTPDNSLGDAWQLPINDSWTKIFLIIQHYLLPAEST